MPTTMRNVRLANAYSIYREDTEHPDTGQHHATHVTGFDQDGNAVRPVHHVPDTAGVRAAINEGRLEEVRDSDVERINAEQDAERQRVADSRPATPQTMAITKADFDAQIKAAVDAALAANGGSGKKKAAQNGDTGSGIVTPGFETAVTTVADGLAAQPPGQ